MPSGPEGICACLRFQFMAQWIQSSLKNEARVNENFLSKCIFKGNGEVRGEISGCRDGMVKDSYIRTQPNETNRNGLRLWEPHPEGHVAHYCCLARGLILPASSPLCPPPTAGQGGREKSLTWPPVKWACQEPLEIEGGTNAGEGETHALQSAMKCNLAPIGLGLQGASIDQSPQNNREEGVGRERGAWGGWAGCGVWGHSTS